MYKKKIFFRFLLPNLIVLLISLFIACICIFNVFASVRQDKLQLTSTIADQIEARIETDLISAKDFSFSIFQDSRIRYTSVLPPELLTDSLALRDISQQIKHFTPASDLFFTHYLILNKSGLVFSASSYDTMRQFYGIQYRESDWTYEQWQEQLQQVSKPHAFLPVRPVHLLRGMGIVSADCIPLVLNSEYGTITAVYMIDVAALGASITSNLPASTGTYQVLAEDGTLIYDYAPDYDVSSCSSTVFSSTSDQTGWTYRLYIPNTALYHGLYTLLIILALAFLVFFFGTLSITLYRTYRLSKPLMQAEKLLFSKKGTVAALHPMDSIVNILENHNQIANLSVRQNAMLCSSFLKQLTLGEFQSDAELQRYLEMLELPQNGKNFQIIAGTISAEANPDGSAVNTNPIRSVLFAWLNDYFAPVPSICLLVDPERFIILLFYDREEDACRAWIEEKMNSLTDAISSDIPYDIYFSLSDLYGSLLLTPKAYAQTLETLSILPSVSQSRHWSWPLSSDLQANGLYYNFVLENQMLGFIRAGSYEETEAVLQTILDENLHKRDISLCAYYQLVFSLKSFIYRLLQEFGPGSDADLKEELDLSACLSTRDLNRVLVVLRRVISYYCDQEKKNHTIPYSKPMQTALEILNKEFSSPDMSVSYMAQQLHLSDNYFSQLFKKETGETFSSYLENLRLEYAIKLLQEDYLIGDISLRCGYLTAKSFQRAFKRRFGTTASDYRANYLDVTTV